MTQSRMLGAAVLLCATMATPVLAQEGVLGPGSRYGLEPQAGPLYHRGYDALDAPRYYAPWRNDFHYGGRHPSRVGAHSSSRYVPN
jgi:hypothetical protein